MISSAISVGYRVATFGGDLYFVPEKSAHRPACRAILSKTLYEPSTHEIVRQIIESRPGSLIHAGTFFGDMVPSFSKIVGNHGRVFAFEPVLENYLLAKLTVEANGIKNVFLQNSGLSSEFGVLQIKTEDTNGVSFGGGSTISPAGDETITVLPIDSLNIRGLSCIQLDVEEHELQALQGARETIARERPTILVEDYNRNCDAFLESFGYTLSHTTQFVRVWAP